MHLKHILVAVSVSLLVAVSQAQTAWPSKPVTLIVPYAAGTSPDIVARNIGPDLAARLGQAILVENVTGAGGVIGTDRVVHAAADGYTLVLGVESTVLTARMVSPSTVKYDDLKDLAPVTLIASAPLALVGKPNLPASTLAELLALLRANPDKYSYGTSGVGTSLHLAGEIFNQAAKTRVSHVPYRASSQLVVDLAGNQIDLAFLPVGSVLPQVKAGKIKAFAVTSPQRFALLPDAAAFGEVPALKDVDIVVWFGLLGPAGLDKAIAQRVNKEVTEILSSPVMRAKFGDLGMQVVAQGPDAFNALMKEQKPVFEKIVKDRNIRAD